MALPDGVRMRPADERDAEAVARIRTARHPDQPWPAEDILFHWRQDRHEHDSVRWILEEANGVPFGCVAAVHRRWELNAEGQERWGRISLDFLPGRDDDDVAGPALDAAEAELSDAAVVKIHVRESDSVLLGFLEGRGYTRERLGRWSELDIMDRGPALRSMQEAARERMRAQGIALRTLDALTAERGDAVMREIYAESNLAEEDVPTTEPYYPAPYPEFLEWFARAGLHHDRVWVATGPDGRVMGLSMLLYPSVGPPWTDWTFTSRHARGLGVARALKLETALQARDLGAERIRTENDGENRPILHLNDEFGYRVIPGEIELIKRSAR